MALILNIDTSTSVCSVALAQNVHPLALKENTEGLNHSLLLGTFINDILKENGTEVSALDAIAVSMGPGSYTGLRIGVSMAKGLCYGASKPLIAVNTLQALAQSVSSRIQEEALYCPMIDARRMEVYTALFDKVNRTGVERVKRIDRQRADDDHRQRVLRDQLFDEVDAVHFGHLDVHRHHIGF